MQWLEFYAGLAADIRMVCYAVVGVVALLQAANYWHKQVGIVSAIHLITGFYMLMSFHFAWTRDPNIALYATTPLVVAWAVVSLFHARRWFG